LQQRDLQQRDLQQRDLQQRDLQQRDRGGGTQLFPDLAIDLATLIKA
jgi:hypothetical protein